LRPPCSLVGRDFWDWDETPRELAGGSRTRGVRRGQLHGKAATARMNATRSFSDT
jgi:hypothetical protein